MACSWQRADWLSDLLPLTDDDVTWTFLWIVPRSKMGDLPKSPAPGADRRGTPASSQPTNLQQYALTIEDVLDDPNALKLTSPATSPTKQATSSSGKH